ncbi:MAG: ribbon-helix-helix domain-containing protein [Acidimicrobiales bacterium]
MARTQVTVQLTDELVRSVDEEAVRRQTSRSAVIRDALRHHLAQSTRQAVTHAIVEGYRKVPPGLPDAWGDLEAQGDRATLEVLQRLDAEERASGHEAWSVDY